jgi:hypothetical protein
MVTFDYTFKYDDDEVEFAYCVPYTYSKLIKFIHSKIEEMKVKE